MKETAQQKSRAQRIAQMKTWMEPPATLDRGYVVSGYLLFAVFGITVVHYGSVTLLAATSAAFTEWLGIILTAFAFISAVTAARDVWYRYETISSILLASAMATYLGAVIDSLFKRDGSVNDLVATFFVLVVIVTALLLARGLTLLRRWVYAAVPQKVLK